MSGWHPHIRGHRVMHHMLREDEPVLLRALKEAGCFVWWGEKNDLIPGKTPLEPYCDVRHHASRPLAANLHSLLEWRGSKDGDNYYSFFAGCLETNGETVYYDSDRDHVTAAVEMGSHSAGRSGSACRAD